MEQYQAKVYIVVQRALSHLVEEENRAVIKNGLAYLLEDNYGKKRLIILIMKIRILMITNQ